MALLDREDKESGFTLVELLVVILIIGVLSAIAIPAFMNQRQRANDATLKANVKNVSTAIETWYVQHPNDPMPPIAPGGWSFVSIGKNAMWNNSPTLTDANTYPQGFDAPVIDEGVSLGVVARGVDTDEGAPGNYCIVAFMENSSYAPSPGAGWWDSQINVALYYDSAVGGLFEAKDLPQGGACGPYATKINEEN